MILREPHQQHTMESGMTVSLYGDPVGGYDVVVRDVVDDEIGVHTPDADGALFAFKALCRVLGGLIESAEAVEVVSAA